MRNFLLALSLLVLSACGNTSGNMGHEVSSWFEPLPGHDNAPAPDAAPVMPVTAAPVPAPAATGPSHAVKVALLLPLSGDQEALGKSLQHGAELAVMEMGKENFELMPRDSGTSPTQAALAAKEVVAQGAELIIGPLFSPSVEAVRPIALASGVPVLALSNDWKVADAGTYVVGFSPIEQMQRIAAFAAKKGISKIGILAPSSAYGDLAIAALQAQGSPVEVVVTSRYQSNAASIATAVQEIAAARTQYQALFLPDGGANLHTIAQQLLAKDMIAQKLPLLGTGLWDDENVRNDAALIGGWYAAPESAARAAFVQRYQKNYGAKPARLASLAYDATALALTLANKGGEHPYTDAALTNPNGFAGLDGIFRFSTTGVAEHGFAVMEVTKAGPKVIDPAPKRF